MLSILATFFSKIVDIILKNNEWEKDNEAPLKLYELYIALREIIKNAKDISREIKDSIGENYHIPHIALQIDAQKKSIDRFTSILQELFFRLEIFNRELRDELIKIIGVKFEALKMYYYIFCIIDHEKLIIKNWDDKEIDRHIDIYECVDFRELDREGFLKAQLFDLSDKETLIMLYNQTLEHIEFMQQTLDSLGNFIKNNFKLNDLFPKKIL